MTEDDEWNVKWSSLSDIENKTGIKTKIGWSEGFDVPLH